MGPLPPTALIAAAAVWLRPLNGCLAAPNAAQIAAAELLPRTFFSLVLVVLTVLVVLGALVVLAVLVALAIFFSELVSEPAAAASALPPEATFDEVDRGGR